MSETNTVRTRNHNQLKPNQPSRIRKYGSALLMAAGLGASGLAFNEASHHADPFATGIAVPTESQPHVDYTARAGDSESAIAAEFGHAGDLGFENMINEQLPKADQHLRTVRPGEKFRLP